MKKYIVTALLATALTAQAQQSNDEQLTPPLQWTCSDIMGYYDDAEAAEGVNEEELEKARVFAMEITLWINGYLTGKHGIDLEQEPFGPKGLRRTMELVYQTCEPIPDTRFLDALKQL
jgi:hypothetical protein